MSGLPNRLSDLLELAVRDAKACEAMPERFVLDMGKWHQPSVASTTKPCAVCMAGAVMAQTLGVPDNETRVVWVGVAAKDDIEPHRDGLAAINSMRVGDFSSAASELIGEELLSQAQLTALSAASELVKEQLPFDPDFIADEDEDEDEVFHSDESINSPNFRAPWEIYLQSAEILRGAGL